MLPLRLTLAAFLCLLPPHARAQTTTPATVPVSVVDTGANYVLSNAFLTASISKQTGDMVSLKYHNLETMGFVSGHHAGYWEQNPAGAARTASTLSIDPANNGGERAEVSIKGWADGQSLNAKRAGRDPGTEGEAEAAAAQSEGRRVGPPPGSSRQANAGTATGRRPGGGAGRPGGPDQTNRPINLAVDMEIRYTLGREDHGIYTYAIFTHPPSYPATSIGESRYGFKLNSRVFDWLSIDDQRNSKMPSSADWDAGSDLNMKEARRLTTGIYKGRAEHKYDYSADQFDTPAFGWSSTHDHVGLYFINPSMEFLSAGPRHFELTGHIDDGDGGDPTLLDYTRGTHYGGSELPIRAGEDWNKVVGPIFIFLDSAPTPEAMFAEARAQAVREAAKWPYPWVAGVDFPQAAQRSTVSGQLLLRDPQQPNAALPHLLVGLAFPDEAPDDATNTHPITWQSDAKHYEFWTRGSEDGRFSIPNVRPGTYQLHAIADGVLGEYARANITITPGGTVDLGKLEWHPGHFGKQLWQIGTPNRSASEFLHGNDHWHWGEYLEYAKLFPKDVDFTVGKSDPAKDWFIYQVPHALTDDNTGHGQGRATTWTIHFDAPAAALPPRGHAVLRLGISAVSARAIDVGLNGKPVGTVSGLVYNATINRDGVEGSWVEKDVQFDSTLIHPGPNTMTLTIPAGGLTSGIAYDVLRLEIAPDK